MPVNERKLRIPEVPAGALPPRAAQAALAADAPLLLVHAPAGFGKSTLLAGWARAGQGAWLSLDKRDTRPRRLAQALVAALRGLCPGSDAQWANWLETLDSDEPDLLLEAIEGQAGLLDAPARLVIDDLHLLAGSPALELLGLWLAELPEDLHLALGARHQPEGLPLARWRLQGQLADIGPGELRWGHEELSRFFAEQGFDTGTLARIGDKSQGWALACQLLRLQLQQGVELDEALDQLGRHRLLEDYLQQEVLPYVPAEALDFLVQTSILSDLTPAICAALVPDGQDLSALARRLPFLSAIDRHRHWYVCHPLLRDWLQQQLESEAKSRLHAAAARYFLAPAPEPAAATAWREAALEHAMQAQNPDVLAEVLEAQARTLLGLGQIQTLQQGFEALPEASLRARPALAMFQIWIWLLTGKLDDAEAWIAWLEALPEGALPDREGQVANLRGTLARRGGPREQMIEMSRRALAVETEDPFIPACAWFNLGLGLMAGESAGEAEDAFQHASLWNRRAGNLITHFAARVCQARLYLRRGELDIAKRAYSDILASGRAESLQRHSLFGVVQLDLARIAYEQDEMDSCDLLLAEGLALTRLAYNLDNVYGYVSALQIRIEARELERAEALLHEATTFAQQKNLDSLWKPVQTLRERLSILQGKSSKVTTGDGWNLLYAALATRHLTQALVALEKLRLSHQGHGVELTRLDTLHARVLELSGDAVAARQQLLAALERAQQGPTLRALLDEASPGLLAWMPSLLAGLKPGFRTRLLEALAKRGFQPEAEALSERERELLACLAEGLNNKQMEDRLFISQNTIKTHLKNLYRKLGVGSRTAAIAKAREQGWI